MKARPDCIVCMFRQALAAARVVTDEPAAHLEVLRRVAARVVDLPLEQTPAALSRPVYAIIAEVTGETDPYRAVKEQTNRLALDLLPRLAPRVAAAADPLDAALHLAAAGNVIDAGINPSFDVERDIVDVLDRPFAIDNVEAFRRELRPGRLLLYLGDNSGEIVFDTVLVRQILAAGVQVTYVVKSGPVINDATLQDARDVGMTALVPVIETGSDDIGVCWEAVSDAFRQAAREADIILGKGHGNFETCNDRPGLFYFLLKAKCPMVAAELGVGLGDIVFKRAANAAPGPTGPR